MANNFNGTQFLSTASFPVATTPCTMAVWFNANNTTSRHSLLTIGRDNWADTNSFFSIMARGDVAGAPIRLVVTGVGTGNTDSTAGYSANTWNHACGVFQSSTSRTIYLNGGNSATSTVSRATTVLSPALRIGEFLSTNPFKMNGMLAEVGIWSAALTAAEIASLAQGMTCDKVRPQSLVFYAPLVRDLIDQKNGLTITNNNGATVANHPRIYP